MVVVVVVMVTELLLLATLIIHVQIRGQRSELFTIPCHICPDFSLQLHSYLSAFIALFEHYLPSKLETCRYSV